MSRTESGNNITNGLIFYIDASKELNSINYNYNPTQTSSIWYDLSGNGGDINMSASTYTEANGGYFSTLPNASIGKSQGIGVGNVLSQSIGYQGNVTIEIFLYVETISATNTVRSLFQCGISGSDFTTNGPNCFGVGWQGVTPYTNYRPSITANGTRNYSAISLATFTTGSWECMTITMGSAGGNAFRNGASPTAHALTVSSSAGNTIFLGKISANNTTNNFYIADTRIGSIKIWNRVLSDDEILQSYNTTKGRYGL